MFEVSEFVRAIVRSQGLFVSVIEDIAFENGWVRHEQLVEMAEDKAMFVNGQGPANLAAACEKKGSKLVQVLTDYVFSGNEEGERVESDPVGPLSAYGRSKLEGEKQIAALCSKYIIVRPAWLYGYVGYNFTKTMLRLGKSHDQITVVNDRLGNPTSANDLACKILKIALTDNYGTYYDNNKETCSWCDFTTAVMQGAGLDCEVVLVTSEEYKQASPASADRPAFSSLKISFGANYWR